MCASWAVNGPVRLGEWWVLTAGGGGKECHHLPWLLLFQDLLTVPEYSFCFNSFWLRSEFGWAQGLSYSPSSGGHFSSPQSHDVVLGPYFLLSLLLVLGIWLSLIQLPLGRKQHQCEFWKGSLRASSSPAIDLSCSACPVFLLPLFSGVRTVWPLVYIVPLENTCPPLLLLWASYLCSHLSQVLCCHFGPQPSGPWYPGNRGAFSGIRRTNCKSEGLLWALGLGYRILILCWQRV